MFYRISIIENPYISCICAGFAKSQTAIYAEILIRQSNHSGCAEGEVAFN